MYNLKRKEAHYLFSHFNSLVSFILLFSSCANLNDGYINIAEGVRIYRSGDSTNFLSINRKLDFNSSKYSIIKLGLTNELIALETWDISKLTRENNKKEILYFLLQLNDNTVIGNLTFNQLQEELKKRGVSIKLESPYNWHVE